METTGPLRDDRRTVERLIELLVEDERYGQVRPIEEYLARFRGLEDAVREEYEAIVGETVSPSGQDWVLGHYRLEAELGHGGQGTVYAAKDTKLERRVAVKVLHSGPRSVAFHRRFQREATVAARLDHPGICPVYDWGTKQGTAYLVMRFLKGETLAKRLRSSTSDGSSTTCVQLTTGAKTPASTPDVETDSGPRGRKEILGVIDLIEQAARALHAAHSEGIVHRDVKPANIMISSAGEPTIMDFGLARDDAAETLTESNDVLGTPAYMSPEQLSTHGPRIDARTDVWSLGVTLFECLTLQRPFRAPTRESLFQAILFEPPPDPRKLNPAIGRDLAVVLGASLEKNPDRRYQTARELADDLARVRQHRPIAARAPSLWGRAQRWVQRNPGKAAASLGLTIVLALTLAWLRSEIHREEIARRARGLEEETTNLKRRSGLLSRIQARAQRRLSALMLEKPELVRTMGWRSICVEVFNNSSDRIDVWMGNAKESVPAGHSHLFYPDLLEMRRFRVEIEGRVLDEKHIIADREQIAIWNGKRLELVHYDEEEDK